LDHAFRTSRVQRALQHLGEELDGLVDLATPISHVIEEEPTKAGFDAMRAELALLAASEKPTVPPGPTLVAIPPQLVFTQPQRVSTDSPPQLLTIFNVGSSSASMVATVDSPEFKIIEPDPFPTVLTSQATLAVSITFTPTEPGPRETQLTVHYNGVGTTTLLQISLKGTGVAQRS
jgi:hypothetical protein